ncbi:16S rRNA pseudouridine(516) synthase [Lentibacillus sp. JNUCC-1]|uniref:pseudouridine synthase n=1 Tax=Lentibacillus sp. JNUCC-1 TaxID=2654513 RepID=UPI0012E90BB2|nr:pseudouridine synthase [Lentibacillus sp. JNUCC-1]MUV39268.1 16S rRNA pseudouridine(516) synthase [Lentibacillus sp. JNUCC-1]
MRLDKLLANTGYGSRKDVKALLKKSMVMVNDTRVKNGSIHVDPEQDFILVEGEPVVYEKYIYLMMNKPKDVISATDDLRDRTVIDLLPPEYHLYKPFPVGRLDKDTEGLLLITNDGQLAHQLTTPKNDVPKTYYAIVEGRVTEQDAHAFSKGVTLDDGYETKPGKLVVLSRGDISHIELTITEGKFHQVKRMFEAVGKKVAYLKRLSMADLHLDEALEPGEYRRLTEHELKEDLTIVKPSHESS